jgi:hypothetical protein
VDWLLGVPVILGMFVLRLGVPLMITLGVGYLWRRLDAKWQAEAEAQQKADRAPQKAVQSGVLDKLTQSCWSIKGCDEAVRANCAAFKQPDTPCWLARRRSEGGLPTECYSCEQFTLRQIA